MRNFHWFWFLALEFSRGVKQFYWISRDKALFYLEFSKLCDKYKNSRLFWWKYVLNICFNVLVGYIKYKVSCSFPLNIKQICADMWKMVEEGGGGLKNITLQKLDNLDWGWARMANQIVIEHHFKTLKRVLEENNFLGRCDDI